MTLPVWFSSSAAVATHRPLPSLPPLLLLLSSLLTPPQVGGATLFKTGAAQLELKAPRGRDVTFFWSLVYVTACIDVKPASATLSGGRVGHLRTHLCISANIKTTVAILRHTL